MKKFLHLLNVIIFFSMTNMVNRIRMGAVKHVKSFIFTPLVKRVVFFVLFLFNYSLLIAQSFPVQLIPQASPPPPIYFSQYADASTTNSPLRLQIVLNDLEISNREIRLKAYFQGNGISFQSNDVVVGSSPLFLEGGIPLVLTNAELAPYFRFENITGISPNVYGQAIPEGAYQFCFEVYDVLTGNRLSQKSCAISVVFQNEPPFLISPRNKSLVPENNPQNIIFQWTPRSINVSNVEYELSLVEIWDTQIDPQAAFLSSPPVFQTTTISTTYVYGPADPLLLSGKNYAWRVQAKAKQGAEDIGLFKNQGYSEIFSFSYAGSCDLPLGISHEVKGSTNANIFWDDFSTDIPEYTIRYRQKSPSTSAPLSDQAWFMNKTTTNQTTLWDLKAGTTYEYQLQKKCTVTSSEWSAAKQFTTFIADNEASVYQCGITPNFSLTNKEPLPKINTGETFVAGDFPINVLEVSGSNGRFTGKGYVTIPYLNSIRVGVKFTNVLINTDKQMSEGTVVTVYDPTLASILDVDEVVETVDTISDLVAEPFEGDNDLDEMRVNFIIPRDSVGKYIEIKDGMVTITNPVNGATISEPLGDDKVVVDGEGQVYHIDAGGKITDGGQIDSGGAVTSNNVEGISTNGQLEQLTAKDIQITFKEVPGDYGFDEIPTKANANIKKEYTTIRDANGDDYTLVHQAVEKGKTSYLDALISQTGSNPYPLDSIVFKTAQGEKIEWSKLDDNTLRLTLKGKYTFENETIYAVVPSRTDSTKQLTAGAFTLWHMTDRPVDVVLVSVNGGNVNGLATEIAKIFKKGVTTLNIETQTAESDLDPAVLGDNGLLDIGDSGWLTNYNAEQKAVIADLKNKIDYNTNNYYVFVFGSNIAPTKPIGGFMPLQRQFGFVFTSSNNLNADEEGKGVLAQTIPHEIGHWVFALQHPFDQYGKDIDGKTDWLMDYANGSLLSHMDWKQLHNPELKFYVFQDDVDGEGTFPDPIMVERYIERYRCSYKSGETFKYVSTESSNVWAKNITIGGVLYDELRIEILKNNSPFIPKGYSDDIYNDLNPNDHNSDNSGVNNTWTNESSINFKNYFRIHFPKDKLGSIASYLYPSDDQWQKHVDARLEKISSLSIENDKELLKILSPCILKNLPVVKRVNLINNLSAGTTTESKEEIILDLVEHISANEIDAFLILLAGTPYKAKVNTSLLHALINDEINDSFVFGDDNLQILIQALARLTKKSNAFNNNIKSLSADDIRYRMINYDYKSIWERLGNYAQPQNIGFAYSIKTDVSMEQLNSKITIKSTLMDGGFIPFEVLSEKPFDAFEPIIFINKSNLTMLDIYDNETYQIVPAVVAKYADKKAWNKTTSDIINATIDAVSLATGYGEIKVAITGIRKALIITDMVNAGVNLTLNVSGAEENLSENSQKVLTAFNVLSGAIGAVESMAGKNIDQIFKSVDKSSTLPQKQQAQVFLNNIVNADQDLSKLSSKELESIKWMANRLKVDAKLNDLSDLEKSVDEAIDILNHLTEGIDDLSSLIKKWDILTVDEASILYSKLSKSEIVGNKTTRTQPEILEEINKRGITNPYNFAYEIEDYVLTKEAYFVRAYNQYKTGRWMVSIEDMSSFSSVDDFINKTALPVVDEFGSILKPDKLVLVKMPAETTIRKSVARPQDWGGQGHLSGGATQFEIIDFDWQNMEDWFKDMGNFNEFIN
jgi:hypothetical protein